jgi:hypothetical protein
LCGNHSVTTDNNSIDGTERTNLYDFRNTPENCEMLSAPFFKMQYYWMVERKFHGNSVEGIKIEKLMIDK